MDLSALREDFPLFAQRPELVYLDSAATSQKPRRVIEALRRYYETLNANVHRGAYRLSAEATEAYEEARRRLARFLNAEPKEIVFVRNTTEAMNLVAYAWGLRNLKEGDEVYYTPEIFGNPHGTYAEYVVLPEANLAPKPKNLSFEEAAAIPLTFLTAWQMVVDKLGVRPGDDVLVMAAGSGVSVAAIQIAKLFGARVIATAGSEDKLRRAKALGADETVN